MITESISVLSPSISALTHIITVIAIHLNDTAQRRSSSSARRSYLSRRIIEELLWARCPSDHTAHATEECRIGALIYTSGSVC
jgi:hypothetical protein